MLFRKSLISLAACIPLGVCLATPSLCAAEKADKTQAIVVSSNSDSFSAAVDEIVTATMLKLKIPSVTVAVAHNGVLLHTGAYGLAHVNKDVVPTLETAYLLDSLTKQFTAAGIMLLVQDGKLDLDKPVKTYVPYAPRTWDNITLRHLLTHTAGLPHDPQWGFPPVKSQDHNPDRLLKHYIFNQHLASAPGEKYAYSNTGYAALGAILAKVSGTSYSDFVRDRIFQSLQMTSTGISYSGGDLKQGARGYNYVPTKKDWDVNLDGNQPLAAGSIRSNVLDLAKWDAALDGDRILTAASKQEMWKSFKLTSGKTSDYGFGWVPETVNGQPMVWHNGGGWGFNTAFYRFLGPGLSVIVLTNLEVEDTGTDHACQLAQAIAAAYSPDLTMSSNGGSGESSSQAGKKTGNTGKSKKPGSKAKSDGSKGGAG